MPPIVRVLPVPTVLFHVYDEWEVPPGTPRSDPSSRLLALLQNVNTHTSPKGFFVNDPVVNEIRFIFYTIISSQTP